MCPQAQTTLWHGLVAPLGVPTARLRILTEAFQQAANSEKFREFTQAQGGKVVASDTIYPHEPRRQWDESIATLERLAERLGDAASKAPSRQLPSLLVRAISVISPDLRGLVPELGRRNDVTSGKARALLDFTPRPAADTIAVLRR